MQELIDTYIEAKSWSREKTKNTAIRYLNLIARLLDNPRPIDITGGDAVTFARKYIKEFTAEKGKPPALGLLKDIQSNGSQFMKYWVRDELAEDNPLLGADLRNLGANEVAKSYQPFEKDELKHLFALPMPDADRLLLSILITTGMRLDEAALLTWDQISSEDGIRYF